MAPETQGPDNPPNPTNPPNPEAAPDQGAGAGAAKEASPQRQAFLRGLGSTITREVTAALAGVRAAVDVQALERAVLPAVLAGGGVGGGLRAAADNLAAVLPGAQQWQLDTAKLALGLAAKLASGPLQAPAPGQPGFVADEPTDARG